jgi:hypothetical protein
VNYILDADIAGFFDAVDQTWLVRFLDHRIGDPRIIRLIQKWLRAGVLEDGEVLGAFRDHVVDLWRRSLRRRGQRDKTRWERIAKLADDWLPKPRILHPWPRDRFAVKHPRWEPYAGIPPVRFCAGGAQK